MNLRQRTLLHTGAVVFVMIILMYAVLSYRIQVSYQAMENAGVEGNCAAAKNAFADVLESVSGQARDWAFWDDAYGYAAKPDPEFIKKNITPSTFDDLKIDLIGIFSLDGRLLYGQDASADSGGAGALPEEFLSQVGGGGLFLRSADETEPRTGLICLADRPLLFAAAPILRSDETGPARGTVIFARSLDTGLIRRIETMTGLRLSVHPVGGTDAPADIREVREALLAERPSVIRAAGPDVISISWLMKDCTGRPALIFRADAPRPVYIQSRTARRYLLIALLVLGVVFLGMNLIFLDILILRRVGRIGRLFERVRTSGDTSARLRLDGRDELAEMGASFDRLLETMEEFRRRDRELSITDPLTTAYNRRHFNDKLAEEFERAKRYGRALSLVILDVDYFKEYNDTRGHQEGDLHLKRTAELLRAMTRKQDIATRFGGDEFALLLPETSKEAARGLAERIRARAAAAGPTLSLGVATYPDDAADSETLITKADGALYKAKGAGRDRVETA